MPNPVPLGHPLQRFAKEALLLGVQVAVTGLIFSPVVSGKRTFLTWYDNSVQYFAWMHRIVESWASLTPPLWDFATDSGTPFAGELQTGAFYPLAIVFAWIARELTPYLLDWFILLHFAIAWYGMTLFTRLNGLPLWPAALLAGAVYAFGGPVFTSALAQANFFSGLVYLPLVLATFTLAVRGGEPAWRSPAAVASGILLGLALLAGHPQPFVYGTILLIGYAAFLALDRRSDRGRLLSVLALAGAVSAAMVGVQVLASLEYFGRAYRWVGLPQPVRAFAVVPYAGYTQYQLQWPDLVSAIRPFSLASDAGTLYITVTALVLAVIGLASGTRLRWFAVAAILVAILVALGDNTPAGWAAYQIPVVNHLRVPVRILFMYQFGAAVLAGLGVHVLSERARRRRWMRAAVLVGLAGAFVAETITVDNARLPRIDESPNVPHVYYRRGRIVSFLERQFEDQKGLFRVLVRPKELLPPNLGHVFPAQTVLGHRSSMLIAYFEYLERDWSVESATYDRLGARYLVTDQPLVGFSLVMQEDRLYLYERPAAFTTWQFIDTMGRRQNLDVAEVRWRSNAVYVRYRTPEPGRVVFAQPAYHGWRARIKAQPADPVADDDGFLAFDTPGGEADIALEYRPWWLYPGLGLWGLVLVAGLNSLRRFPPRK